MHQTGRALHSGGLKKDKVEGRPFTDTCLHPVKRRM